jgi:hypothetical protein
VQASLTEGRGFKFGFTLPIDPLLNSDEAMRRYLLVVSEDGKADPLDILNDDDDSLPCVHRVWKLDTFDDEIVELAAKAWWCNCCERPSMAGRRRNRPQDDLPSFGAGSSIQSLRAKETAVAIGSLVSRPPTNHAIPGRGNAGTKRQAPKVVANPDRRFLK